MKAFPRWAALACVAAGLLAVSLVNGVTVEPDKKDEKVKADSAAVERTRETVKMLDDLYKSALVHITNTYVKARESKPAAAKKVFKDMADKGHHTARLIDATGDPINKTNVAKSPFERRALEKLKKGEKYYDEVGTVKGKPVLRAATIVPVVMKACLNCHPGVKEGQLMGAITYELPIK